MRAILRLCKQYWRPYALGTLALLLVDILDTFTPKVVQWAIDHLFAYSKGTVFDDPIARAVPQTWFAPGGFMAGMWVYAVALIGVVAITGLFRFWMSYFYGVAGLALTHELRRRFFAHLQRLSASFHDKSKIGDQMTHATSDIDSCRMFYGVGLLLAIDTMFYFVLVPTYMVSISWKLTLASILPLPLIPLLISRLFSAIETRYERVQEQFGTLSERSRESFSGVKVIKSFAQEEAEVRSLKKLGQEYLKRSMHYARVMALESPAIMLILGLADLVVVVYGGHLVLQKELSVGQFAAFFQYLVRLSGPLIGLGWVITLYQRGSVSLGRIQKILDTPIEIKDAETASVKTLQGSIDMRHLAFAYGNGPQVLSDINIRLKAGQTLGIIGAVGSGKSTLLHLLTRLYEAPRDALFIDGIDVRDIPLAVLRQHIGVVSQDTFLFSETIRDNIALGMTSGANDDESIRAMAKMAHIDNEIMLLPKGYQTLLGEKGVNLSGGQKQRIAIARALARRPAILLLDDCLSAVDTYTESLILHDLKQAMQQCTTLIISHRLSTVEHADEIIVLDNGRICERGTHATLLAAGGVYAELYAKQQLEENLEIAESA